MAAYFGCKCGAKNVKEHVVRVVRKGYPGHVFKANHYWVTRPEKEEQDQ